MPALGAGIHVFITAWMAGLIPEPSPGTAMTTTGKGVLTELRR